jgi:surface polysaccharide O-acyltransferase-like enzyme
MAHVSICCSLPVAHQVQYLSEEKNKPMSDQSTGKQIVPWADLIRVVAIYLVVVIHVSGQSTDAWGKIPTDQWIIADIYGGMARVAVPLFFMISGYLLLPRSESLRDFYAKRMTKILIPFVIWSLIYLGWYCGTHPGTCTPALAWKMLRPPGAYYHLWFLYSLLSVYLILPILRLIIRPDTERAILWYLIILWLIFQPILTFANTFWNADIRFTPPLTTGFACFFVLGYLLGEIPLSRHRILLSVAGWGIGILITVLGTYIRTRSAGQFDGFFYDFVSLNIILASAAAFILLRWLSDWKPFTNPKVLSILRSLATAAFGIYLIHVIVKEVLSGWLPFVQINSLMGNAWWSIPLTSTVVFLVSFLMTRLLQRIPVLRPMVP